MKEFDWDTNKNLMLMEHREISFDEIVEAISTGNLLVDVPHHRGGFEHQRIFIVRVRSYAYVVPYVTQEDGTRFLKTIYPSRRATKKYIV